MTLDDGLRKTIDGISYIFQMSMQNPSNKLLAKYKGKRILVTGANGFIGSHLLEVFSRCKCKVFAVAHKKIPGRKKQKDVKWFLADVRDEGRIKEIVQTAKPDFIFHLAALLPASDAKTEDMFSVNFLGTFNVLQALKNYRFSKFIFMGSSAEYGRGALPFRETQKPRPVSDYGFSKAIAVELCLFYHRAYGYPVVVLRPTTIYGPGQTSKMFLPDLLAALIKGEDFCVKTGIKRDFVYVNDAAEALLSSGLIAASGLIINIGSGKSVSFKDAASLAKKMAMSQSNLVSKPCSPWDIKNDSCDVSRAKEILKWRAKTSFQQGLAKTIQHYRAIHAR